MHEATVDLSKDLHKKFATWVQSKYPGGLTSEQWQVVIQNDQLINYSRSSTQGHVEEEDAEMNETEGEVEEEVLEMGDVETTY